MYAATLATGGLIAFVWIVMLMRDVNQLERRSAFPSTQLAIASCLGLSAFLFLIFALPSPATVVPGMSATRLSLIITLGVVLSLYQFVSIVLVSRHVNVALGARFRAIDVVASVLLTLCMLLSLPMTQRRLNNVIERKGASG
jgi:hypothetical protein